MRTTDGLSRVGGMSLRQAALVAGLAYLLNPVTFAEGTSCLAWSLLIR